MSEFMFLFRGNNHEQLSPEELQSHLQLWKDWLGRLTAEGTYKGGLPLGPESKVVAGANRMVTDGPFVESKEMIGGYLIVEAKDLDTAVEIAKGCPTYEADGLVEVRPINPMPM